MGETGEVPVYRVAPDPLAATATLPAVGAVATTDIWVETVSNSTTPEYIMLAKAGVAFYAPASFDAAPAQSLTYLLVQDTNGVSYAVPAYRAS